MTDSKPSLIVVGDGGHAAVVRDLLQAVAIETDATVYSPHELVIGEPPGGALVTALAAKPREIVLAIGDNWRRWSVAEEIRRRFPNTSFRTLVHPTAYVSQSAEIGLGTLILGRAWVGPQAQLGQQTLVNTSATVEHHCVLEDFASIGPGGIMAGQSTLGFRSVLGLGASTLEGRSIGKDSVVGASSLVTRDVPESVIAIGVPAKVKRLRHPGEPYMKGPTP